MDDGHGGAFAKALAIGVSNVNEAPMDVALVGARVLENQAAGTSVGVFSTSDRDAGDSFSYSFVAGASSADNASFTISGNRLKTSAAFDFETKSSYSIRVRTTDSGARSFEKRSRSASAT